MLTYADGQPITEYEAKLLRIRKARLERAENAWKTGPRGYPERKAWHKAYVEYWTAMVQMEQATAIPCSECDGSCVQYHSGTDAEWPCEDCTGTGKWACVECGDRGATVLDDFGDPICNQCKRETS